MRYPGRRRLSSDRSARVLRVPVAQAMESLESRLLFAFGVTATTGGLASYTIDNGGNLKFSVLRETATNLSSTIHVGDMTSIKYKGQEMLASYSVTSRYSHYEQGLSSTTKVSYVVDNTNGWILVKCDDSATASDASQYYVVRKNDDNIYMASLPSDVTAGPGEGRFIAYLDRNVFANPEAPSDNAGTTGAIEGSDVYGHADGTTSSKFYNMGRRMIENVYHGLTGTAGTTAVGAWMFMGNREHSAGGPFFKDIDFQSGSAVEMYNCIFTGHTQTESFRQGLHVYAMQFTSGSLPTTPDYSWLETLKDSGGNFLISGLVPASARGTLSGVASGVPAGHEVTDGLANSDAQYWDAADSAGNYVITGIQPGTYTETLYDGELEVGTKTVTITAGHTTSSNILDTFYSPTPTWRIGTWDGTPLGFMNSEPAYPGGPGKIEIMHPSDVRMTNWGSTPNFVIGTNTDSQWPLAQFMGVNNSQRITFQLTSAQASVGQTLRIGITWGFSGARPKITVNAGQTGAWTSANPSASSDLNSRGITRGTWRGDNQMYTFNIPTSALKIGTNSIDLPLISGSYVAGQTWLSPNVAYDAIDLVPTSAASIPTIASVTITPLNSSVAPNGTKVFTAVAKDAAGNVVNANFSWSAARGTIDGNGSYIAPATEGADTITVTATNNPRTAGYSTSSSSTSAFAATTSATSGTTVNVMGTVPIVVNPASANPNPAPYGSTVLSVLGNDDGGEANLKYTWSVVGTSPGGVTFSANGTNTAKTTTATFSAQGTYNFLVTIADQNGNTRTSSVSVNATQNIAWYQNDVSAGPTLPDSFGNGLDATANGSYGIVPGVSGNAVQLAGGNVTMPAGILSALNNFTIATWVKLDSIATWARVLDFGTGTTNYMFLTPQSSAGVVRFAIRTPAVSEQDLDGSFTVPSGASAPWTHIAVTFALNSGSTTNYTGTLYVNGVAIATKTNFTLKPSSLGSTTQNYIGESQFSADPSLMGSVDDFRIYARALSGTEVKALAGGTVSGTAFNDVNANGAFDSGEPTLSGVQVYLDANNNRVLDGSELSTTTGAAGNYAFSNVPAGSYAAVARRIGYNPFARSPPPPASRRQLPRPSPSATRPAPPRTWATRRSSTPAPPATTTTPSARTVPGSTRSSSAGRWRTRYSPARRR